MIGGMYQQTGARILNIKDSMSATRIKWGTGRETYTT